MEKLKCKVCGNVVDIKKGISINDTTAMCPVCETSGEWDILVDRSDVYDTKAPSKVFTDKIFTDHEERPEEHDDNDMVNHPTHYISGGMEAIDVIEAFTKDLSGIEAVDTANIIKYALRWSKKGKEEDVRKIIWYAKHLLNTLNSYCD